MECPKYSGSKKDVKNEVRCNEGHRSTCVNVQLTIDEKRCNLPLLTTRAAEQQCLEHNNSKVDVCHSIEHCGNTNKKHIKMEINKHKLAVERHKLAIEKHELAIDECNDTMKHTSHENSPFPSNWNTELCMKPERGNMLVVQQFKEHGNSGKGNTFGIHNVGPSSEQDESNSEEHALEMDETSYESDVLSTDTVAESTSSEPPQLTVHSIVQTGSHIQTEDLVQCSTAVIFNDPTVIQSLPSSQSNTLVLTSVFNNPPVLTLGESVKADISIIDKVSPSDLLLPKSTQHGLTNNGSVLLNSPTQATLLLPSYYQDNEHLIPMAANNVPVYQNTSGFCAKPAPVHACQWQDCNEQFVTLDELVEHMNNIHVLVSKEPCQYSCHWKDCIRQGKGFNARYKLLIHLRTHTGERPHACHFERCDKRFSRLENLKIHCRSHTGEKPYLCPFEGCEKRYSNSSDRFKHTKTHIESKPYRCKIEGCFKQYTDPSSLRKHLKAHKL